MERFEKNTSIEQKVLEKQERENEGIMFDINEIRYEKDKKEYQSLSQEDQVFVNKYFNVLQNIEKTKEDIERNENLGKNVILRKNELEKYQNTLESMNNDLKSKPRVMNFIFYKEEESNLRAPKNPEQN